MNLAKQLRFYLDKVGISASQLAKRASVPKQSLGNWIAGNTPRDPRQIKRVADALGVSLDHLLFGDGEDVLRRKEIELEALLGDQWIGGLVEIRIRRIKRP